MNRPLVLLVALFAGCQGVPPDAVIPTDAKQQGLNPVTGFGSNPGQLSMYLYVPQTLPATKVPVVVAMHGCTQSASAYGAAGWNDLAEQQSFLVIYPQTSANNDCFMWWDPTQARRDQGQAWSIKQMVDYVKGQYDVGEVFVTGLSAGGAMTAVMVAAYPDVFSGGAVMSGIAYRCADTQNDAYTCMFSDRGWSAQQWGDLIRGAAPAPAKLPRVAVWQGTSDYTVTKANADEIVAGWTNVHGLSQSPTTTETVGPATHNRYADASGTVQVEEWLIQGMGHGTALDPSHGCGVAGAFMLDEGICSTRYAADFFFGITASAPGTPGTPPTPTTDAGTPLPPSQCQEFYASNYDHTQAGRAQLCQPLNGHACTKGANDDLGLWNVAQMSWVKETSNGYFAAGRCH
jgi:poly(hydroxyalkanoate) depolymerase family esterase